MKSNAQMSYEIMKEILDLYDKGEIDETHPFLAPGVKHIREAVEKYENNVLKKESNASH